MEIETVKTSNQNGYEFTHHRNELETNGFTLFRKQYEVDLISRIEEETPKLWQTYEKVQRRGRVLKDSSHAMHHTFLVSKEQINLINPLPIYSFCSQFLNSELILNCFGTALIKNGANVYTQNIHRDARSIHSSRFMLNLVIPLTESTIQNGTIEVWAGSHKDESIQKPSDEEFNAHKQQITMKAGDILVFNPFLWHRSGVNKTNSTRSIVSIMLSVPWIKPSLDYPRALGYDYSHKANDGLRQIIGFNARVPGNLEEYYKPIEERFYLSNQK